jgi:predicted HD phosphohydrolase
MPGMSFARMDQSTAEQWAVIADETMKNQPLVAGQILDLLMSLKSMVLGFEVDQLTHSLQTATRAERDGAGAEMVVASLCHDIGKAISVPNHPRIAAEILRPYVDADTFEIIRTHQDFQGRHYFHFFDGDREAREQHRGQPWFSAAEQFADDWDQLSFDESYPTETLEHFEPMVRDVFAVPRII